MEVGSVADQVQVTGEAQTHRSGYFNAQWIRGDKRISELPTNGRTFTSWAALVPGVFMVRQKRRRCRVVHGQSIYL